MIEIRRVATEQEFLAVARFRYEIYVEEMNRVQKDADHERRVIVDSLDDGQSRLFAAWDNEKPVGTVRTNFLEWSQLDVYQQLYSIDPKELASRAISITTRLMIMKSLRSGTLACRLACATYEDALQNRIEHDFIDCNAHLAGYFRGIGYRVWRDGLTHPEYGSVTVMRLDLRDRKHLEAVRSPFRKILERIECSNFQNREERNTSIC